MAIPVAESDPKAALSGDASKISKKIENPTIPQKNIGKLEIRRLFNKTINYNMILPLGPRCGKTRVNTLWITGLGPFGLGRGEG